MPQTEQTKNLHTEAANLRIAARILRDLGGTEEYDCADACDHVAAFFSHEAYRLEGEAQNAR